LRSALQIDTALNPLIIVVSLGGGGLAAGRGCLAPPAHLTR